MRTIPIVFVAFIAACGGQHSTTGRSQNATSPPAYLSFTANWQQVLTGELRQGGSLVINYDLARLTQCRGTHNGYPAWDVVAHARFSPGGELVSGSVRSFQTHQGVPTNVADSVPLEVTIPDEATGVEIWFQNVTGAGSSCVAWDSAYGANYRYEVWPAADDPRCADMERWEAINSDMPYASKPTCLAYTVDAEYDASYCELYLSRIAHGYMAHYGIPNRWVEANIEVGPQQGTVLGVGMYARRRDKTSGELSERTTMARQVGPTSWQTGVITLRTALMGVDGFAYDLDALAFFVDVERPNGAVVRLWQSRHGANYTMNDAFALPTSTISIPYGNVQVADEQAAIFDAKRRCAR